MNLVNSIKKWLKGKKADGVIATAHDAINRNLILESVKGEFIIKVDETPVGSFSTIEEAQKEFEERLGNSNRNL